MTIDHFEPFAKGATAANALASLDGDGSDSSSGTITFDGTSTQNLTSSGDGALPNIEIKKSGKLNITGSFIVNGDWTYVAGNVKADGSTVEVRGGTHTFDTGSSSMAFDDFVINVGPHHFNVERLDINGDLTILRAQTINALGASEGAITVGGDLSSSDTSVGGDAGITLDGSTKTITGGDFPGGGIIVDMNSGATLHANVTTPLDSNLTLRKLAAITGTFQVGKNVSTEDTSVGGSGVIAFRGSSAQTLTAVNHLADVPSVDIEKSGGSLTLANNGNTLAVTGDWIFDDANVGPVTTTGTTVQFQGSTKTVDTGATSMAFNNVEIDMNSGATFKADPMVDVNGALTIIKVAAITGLIKASGHVTTGDTSVGGSGVIRFDGSGAQTLAASVDYADVPSVEIKNTGGTLTVSASHPLAVTGDWDYDDATAGTVITTGSTVQFQGSTKTVDTGAASMAFNDVEIDMNSGATFKADPMVDVNGDLTIIKVAAITGLIKVAGDVTTEDTSVGGNGIIRFDGTTTQTLKSTVTRGDVPSVEIAKSGKLELDDGNVIAVTGDWTYISGTVDENNSVIEFQGSTKTVDTGSASMQFHDVIVEMNNGATLNAENMKGAGDLTINKVGAINSPASGRITVAGDLTSNDTSVGGNADITLKSGSKTITGGDFPNGGIIIDMNSGATLTANVTQPLDGNLVISSVANINGTFEVTKNVTTDDTGVGGSGVIRFTGSSNQTLSATTDMADVPTVEIDKSGGTLTIASGNTISVTGNWIYTDGTVNASGSTVKFQGGSKTVDTGVASMDFNNVVIEMLSGATLTATNMDVDGNLTIDSVANINGTIHLAGNLNVTDTSVGGSVTYVLDGTGAIQTITAAAVGSMNKAILEILNNKSGFDAKLLSDVTVKDLILFSGATLDENGFTLTDLTP